MVLNYCDVADSRHIFLSCVIANKGLLLRSILYKSILYLMNVRLAFL